MINTIIFLFSRVKERQGEIGRDREGQGGENIGKENVCPPENKKRLLKSIEVLMLQRSKDIDRIAIYSSFAIYKRPKTLFQNIVNIVATVKRQLQNSGRKQKVFQEDVIGVYKELKFKNFPSDIVEDYIDKAVQLLPKKTLPLRTDSSLQTKVTIFSPLVHPQSL